MTDELVSSMHKIKRSIDKFQVTANSFGLHSGAHLRLHSFEPAGRKISVALDTRPVRHKALAIDEVVVKMQTQQTSLALLPN